MHILVARDRRSGLNTEPSAEAQGEPAKWGPELNGDCAAWDTRVCAQGSRLTFIVLKALGRGAAAPGVV